MHLLMVRHLWSQVTSAETRERGRGRTRAEPGQSLGAAEARTAGPPPASARQRRRLQQVYPKPLTGRTARQQQRSPWQTRLTRQLGPQGWGTVLATTTTQSPTL